MLQLLNNREARYINRAGDAMFATNYENADACFDYGNLNHFTLLKSKNMKRHHLYNKTYPILCPIPIYMVNMIQFIYNFVTASLNQNIIIYCEVSIVVN